MIQLSHEDRSGWHVVAVGGRADAESADELEAALCQALEHHSRVAADLATLAYISSAGLRALLQAGRAAQLKKAEFAICSLTPAVKRVFDISGLDHFLRIHGELPC